MRPRDRWWRCGAALVKALVLSTGCDSALCALVERVSAERSPFGGGCTRGWDFCRSLDHAPLGDPGLPVLEKAFQRSRPRVGSSWRTDKTNIKVRGEWKHLSRVVDTVPSTKQVRRVDFLLRAHRNVEPDRCSASRIFAAPASLLSAIGLDAHDQQRANENRPQRINRRAAVLLLGSIPRPPSLVHAS
jgi:hypothetical protein